ncbi:MAG: sigma-70 family RNA polymerase sigma factor [Clostridia bacterium]|nr:sigma-70 family RNA polymerase sigma factor [Clostridia bacterium]
MPDMEEMYEMYRDRVYGFLFRLCRHHDLAEEMTQETFYQAARRWKKYRGEASVATWLCAIAKRLYYTELRKRKDIPSELLAPEETNDFSEALADKDMAMAAQKALHQLPEPYREVFTLRTFCDMSHQQIGELFQKSDSWARVTYHRARMMLTEALKGSELHE